MPGAECRTDRQRHTQTNGYDQGRVARRRPPVIKSESELPCGLAAAQVAKIAECKVQGGDQQEVAPKDALPPPDVGQQERDHRRDFHQRRRAPRSVHHALPLQLLEVCQGGTCHTAILYQDPFSAQASRLLFVLRR